jgi:translation initiation factor 1A
LQDNIKQYRSSAYYEEFYRAARAKAFKQTSVFWELMDYKHKKPLSAEEQQHQMEEDIKRTPTPKGRQVLGICEQRVGGSRMKVRCMDGRTRICRIPGRLKRKLWIREGDVLLIEPWELSGNEKGDVIFKYKPVQADVLRKRGMLKGLEAEEF